MADIVLRDRNGNPVEYPGVERVKLNTTNGETVEFVDPALIPESVEKTIDPDFSGGNIVEAPEAGTMFSKVTVNKPATLEPQYIAEGVNIAGIVGTLAAGGGSNVLIKTCRVHSDMTGVITLATAEELSTAGFDPNEPWFICIMQSYKSWGYLSSPGSIMVAIVTNVQAGTGEYGVYLSNYNKSGRTKSNYGTITNNPASGNEVYNTPFYKDGEIKYKLTAPGGQLHLALDNGGANYASSFYLAVGNMTPSI